MIGTWFNYIESYPFYIDKHTTNTSTKLKDLKLLQPNQRPLENKLFGDPLDRTRAGSK